MKLNEYKLQQCIVLEKTAEEYLENDFGVLIESFLKYLNDEEIEIYNEDSLKFELGIFLRIILPNYNVCFEKNIKCFIRDKKTIKHEIDITISDYVADLRAPTPTAAGELAVPDISTIITYLDTAKGRTFAALNNIITLNKKKLDNLKNSYILTRPISKEEIKMQKLDILSDNLDKAVNKILEKNKVRLYTLSNSYVLNNPEMLYKYSNQKLSHIISKLEVLNPLNTLNRGYAIIKKDNKVLSSIKNITTDDTVTLTLKDGEVTSKIIKVGE